MSVHRAAGGGNTIEPLRPKCARGYVPGYSHPDLIGWHIALQPCGADLANQWLRYGGHRAWRAGTRFDDERVRDRFVEVWGVGGGFGFGPASSGRVYWYCFETVPEGVAAPERPRDEFLRRYGAIPLYLSWIRGEERVATPADYLFASPALVERLRRCLAFNPTEWYAFSDHSPIVAPFEV
jgi:hypothetical protein